MAIQHINDEEAREIIDRDLQDVIDAMIRRAHCEGAAGRPARAEHSFTGPIREAGTQLSNQEFEERVRACLSEEWDVNFGDVVNLHAPGILIIRLK